MPAMALRNEIDVAHVELAAFTYEQLDPINKYTIFAEHRFRDLLRRVFEATSVGTFFVPPYQLGPPRRETLEIIEKLRGHLVKSGQLKAASE